MGTQIFNGTPSSFPGGFASGFAVSNIPIVMPIARGQVFWVDNSTNPTSPRFLIGSDSGGKGTFIKPLATLQKAINACVADNGDIIFVGPGHAETITAAAGINLNVAGVTIIGIHNGSDAPTFTFNTATTATIRVSAPNCVVRGMKFVNGINSLVSMFDWGSASQDTVIDSNYFTDDGTNTGLSFIDFVGATANWLDRIRITNNIFYNPTVGNMNHAVGLNTVHDFAEVGGNKMLGTFALSGLHNITGKVLTNLRIHDNIITNLTAGASAMKLISACTGNAAGNFFQAGDLTVADAVFGSVVCGLNNTDQRGAMSPGEVFTVKKTIVSSTITTSPQTLMTSQGGELEVLNVTLKTDATGLAGSTNFQILTNNVKGQAAILVETVANLGANKTVDISSASVTKQKTVIESGKLIQFDGTVGAGTGAGTVDVYAEFRRIGGGAVAF